MGELINIDPGKLTPHPKNSRTHSGDQLAELRASLQEFGMVRPIIINQENVVLAGHGILEAALAEEFESVSALRIDGLSDTEERAYLVADNRIAELSSWDWVQLAEEMMSLGENVALSELGFSTWDPTVQQAELNNREITAEDLETEYTCPCCGFEF